MKGMGYQYCILLLDPQTFNNYDITDNNNLQVQSTYMK